MVKEQKIRTRIAPSPTGYPHIGTLYQALFNFAPAKKENGAFIVRIEDTDRTRFVEGAEEVIYSILDWSGLTENESPRKLGAFGPYRQSERLMLYRKYVTELLDKGHAYYSYYPKANAGIKKDYAKKVDTSQEVVTNQKPPISIEEMIESGEWIIRMKVPKNTQITFKDEIRGDITFASEQVTDQVLLKSDGFPTYHLAVVVDDHLMGITHVIRGEEWISSTPKHILLYKYFEWDIPLFYHTPDLRNKDKSKLSKRHGHTNVNWYREEGYVPEAILNYLALLGWSHPNEKEIFDINDFIEHFDLGNIRAVGPMFDLVKLTWMNQQYLQNFSLPELKKRIISFYPKAKELKNLEKLIELSQTRMETLKDFEKLTSHFVKTPEVSVTEKEKLIAKDLVVKLNSIENWDSTVIFTAMKEVMTTHGVKMPILYQLLTGSPKGLPLPQSLELLGKDESIARLDAISTS